MRTRPRFCLSAAGLSTLSLGLGLFSAPATAGEPSAADLIALAPLISSSDKAIRSIEIAGYHQADGKILRTFRALYRAPDRFAFVVRDGHDGTPLSIAVDRKMLVYDPVRPEMLVFSDASNYQVLKVENGKFEESWGCKFNKRESSHILLDLKSVFAEPPKIGTHAEESVVKTGEKQYILSRKVDKVFRRSRVDLDRPVPFTTFELAASPGGTPHFRVDKIVVNGALDDSEFAFPSLEGLAGTLKVREVEDGLREMAVLLRTYYVRQTLHEPGMKRGVITPLFMGVRWSRVEHNDEQYAKLVRSLIPDDPVSHAIDPHAKADDRGTIERTRFEAIRDNLPHLPFKLRVEVK